MCDHSLGIENGNGGSLWSDIVTIRDHYNQEDPHWELPGKPAAFGLRSAPAPAVTAWLDPCGRNNYTPNLDNFLVQINEGRWRESAAAIPPSRR